MRLRLSAALSSALLGLVLAAAPSGAQAPTGTITGAVVDSASQRPVAGARVTVANASRDTYTKDDGTFTLARVPVGAQRVRVSIIGYGPAERTVTVTAGGSAAVRFTLNRVAVLLPEVVAVGYGTTRRQDITGSVSSVPAEELQRNIVSSVQQGLQGRVAGVSVTQGDAAPGGGIRVQVRGTNSMNPGSAQPLYVIDGVPFASSGLSKRSVGATSEENLNSLTETNPLSTISPADIESIDILKDASATAIYGSRGANGVVIITTKHGARNRTGAMTLTASTGFQSVVREIPMLDAYGFATYVNQAFINAFGPQTQYPYGGREGSRTPEQIRQQLGAGTNWQHEIFRSAPVQDVQLAFTGGDENGSYLVSGNVLNQAGVITGSQFNRGGARLNLDRNVNSRLRVSSNMAVTRSVNDMVRSSTINGWRAVGIVRQALMYQPWVWRDTTQIDPRAEDAATWANYGANPLRYTDEVSETDQVTNGIGGLRGVVQLPYEGLSLDLNVGANYERRSYGTYYPRTVNEGRAANGLAVQSGSEFGSMVSDNLLRFNREYGASHRVDAVAGFSLERRKATWSGTEVQNFPDDILRNNVIGNGTNPQKPYSGLAQSKLASWLGRVNYTAFDRYNFTATVRRDGSSRFAANAKWGTFPAFAFAWQANKEPMLRDVGPLSNLKVRLSYGKSGNQAINEYQSLPAIEGTTMTLNEAVVSAYIVTRLGNPDLRWETTDQYNAGLDLGLWSNRLTGTVDVYRKNTYDLLQNITLAGNTGFGNAWINSGNVSNRGIELQLGYDVLTSARASAPFWNLSVNASHNKNRIESLGPVLQQFAGRLGAGGGLEAAPFVQKPGLAIGTMWGYKTNGIVRTPADSAAESKLQGRAVRVGDIRYVDVDGNGKVDAKDQTVIGDANADWVFGLNNRFTWGKFDLSALVTAVRGNEIINAERIRWMTLDGTQNVPREFVDNSFDPTKNPDGIYPQIRQDRKTDARFHDMFIEDGSYVRLKNVQVGYNVTLPRARSARVYVNGLNLLTRTNYKGFDPEVSAFGSPDRPGVDLGSYPQARTITIGINTSF